jgi:hypothetical protein
MLIYRAAVSAAHSWLVIGREIEVASLPNLECSP